MTRYAPIPDQESWVAKGVAKGQAIQDASGASFVQSAPRRSFSATSLGRMVEGDIIPRLLMVHRRGRWTGAPWPDRSGASLDSLSAEEISRFAPLPLDHEASDLLDEIEQYLDRGVSAERIFLDLLATSARTLGELWESDACDFLDVTMGLWRLQEVMRVVAMRSPTILRTLQAPFSVLIAAMPGDQHSFGALMVEEVFARAGWESEVVVEPKRNKLLEILSNKCFDVVGLTVTNDCPSGVLADLVSAIRSVSRNPAIRVIVGGRAINADQTLAVLAGSDGSAGDAVSAVILAEQLMSECRAELGQL